MMLYIALFLWCSGWISGQSQPLPESIEPINPYVYLAGDNTPSQFPNEEALLVISGWANLSYRIVITDSDIDRSPILKTYYRADKPECHEFITRFTFAPKRGIIETVERIAAAYPPQFVNADPNTIEIRISQFSSQQEQLTKLVKTMNTVSVELIDCNGNRSVSWTFTLTGARDALAEVER